MSTIFCASDKAEKLGRKCVVQTRVEGKTESATDKIYSVLLVEDDNIACEVTAAMLRDCSYEVTIARNGREALNLMHSHFGDSVDVILTDNFMPEVNGIELVYSVVREERRNIPVVVTSSDSSQRNVLEAFEAGAVDYLVKPLRRHELATLWLHAWRAKSGLPGLMQSTSYRPCSTLDSNQSMQTSHDLLRLEPAQGSVSSKSFYGNNCGGNKRVRLMDQLTAAAALRANETARTKGSVAHQDEECNREATCRTERTESSRKAPKSKLEIQQGSLLNAWQDTLHGAAQLMNVLALTAKQSAETCSGASLEIKPLNIQGTLDSKGLGLSSALAQQKNTNLCLNATKIQQSVLQALVFNQINLLPAVVLQEVLDSKQASATSNLVEAILAEPRDQERSTSTCTANRQAAILKFRAKRKMRNFEKRVRYASRQRLAESRPRVRGQFVRAEVLRNCTPSD